MENKQDEKVVQEEIKNRVYVINSHKKKIVKITGFFMLVVMLLFGFIYFVGNSLFGSSLDFSFKELLYVLYTVLFGSVWIYYLSTEKDLNIILFFEILTSIIFTVYIILYPGTVFLLFYFFAMFFIH